jgi:hypothetical protein
MAMQIIIAHPWKFWNQPDDAREATDWNEMRFLGFGKNSKNAAIKNPINFFCKPAMVCHDTDAAACGNRGKTSPD